jgi:hypothetical protein
MDNIIEPNESFDFSKLTLAHPVGIQGGAYFTKIEYNKKPLYIQTIKSQTRQGFVKTGKKYYCDLMFDKNAESLIHWFENLEEKCQKLIFEKRDTWFQNSLEESDIESAFSSTIRVYKSGKFYLVRTNVKNNPNNLPSVKIYNEHQISLNMEDVNSETNIISILEIQGIKFTTRNFQIEIELKQVMVLDNEPLFDNCLIKFNKDLPQLKEQPILKGFTNANINDELNIETHDKIYSGKETKIDLEKNYDKSNNILEELEPIDIMIDSEAEDTNKKNITNINVNDKMDLTDYEIEVNGQNEIEENIIDQNEIDQNEENEIGKNKIYKNEIGQNNIKDENISLDFEDLTEDIEEKSDELKEINNFDLSLGNNTETMQLKKPNQVYFELYKEARNKAKIAKKNALLAYLEAKNIKKTYMIENLNESDSDIDDEIDEVSESELEGL